MLTKIRNSTVLIAVICAFAWFILPRFTAGTDTDKDDKIRVIWRVTYDGQAGGVHIHWMATDGQQGDKTVTYTPFNNADRPLFVRRGTVVTLWVYSFQGTSRNGNKSCQLFMGDSTRTKGSVHTQGMADLKCEDTA